jgi:hypothetical protein
MQKISEWMELNENKLEFLHILRVLNRYYEAKGAQSLNNTSHEFRKELTEKKESDFQVFLKKFGDFEFLVHAKIGQKPSQKSDTWIHIDGIAEEREQLIKSGITDHPIFSIVGLRDLYLNHSHPCDLKDLPE